MNFPAKPFQLPRSTCFQRVWRVWAADVLAADLIFFSTLTKSAISVTEKSNMFPPIRLAVASMKFVSNGFPVLPIIWARAPKPSLRCIPFLFVVWKVHFCWGNQLSQSFFSQMQVRHFSSHKSQSSDSGGIARIFFSRSIFQMILHGVKREFWQPTEL